MVRARIKQVKAYLREHPGELAVVASDYELVELNKRGIPLTSLGRLVCYDVGTVHFLAAKDYAELKETEQRILHYGAGVRG